LTGTLVPKILPLSQRYLAIPLPILNTKRKRRAERDWIDIPRSPKHYLNFDREQKTTLQFTASLFAGAFLDSFGEREIPAPDRHQRQGKIRGLTFPAR
jgi:hypothetical protein